MSLFIPPELLKKILVDEKLVTPERFDALLSESERKNQSLIDVLISQRIADAAYLNSIIAGTFGVELANIGTRQIDEEALRLLPEEVARQRQVVVFGRETDGTLQVAMSDPGNLETIEFLQQRLKARVRPFLAIEDDLNRAFEVYGYRSTEDFKKIIEENIQTSLKMSGRSGEEAATDLPIVAIVDTILSYAVASRSSDIHIEILEEATLVRYRIDGILTEIIRIPKSVHSALVARVKILSGLRLDEHYKPQDGRFRYQIVNQTVDVRVSIMPTYYGEKAEMRLLESTQKPLALEEIGMLPVSVSAVRNALGRTFGMVLICGPTGSGKTTTLYSIMNILNRPEVNIASIEDPIEYNMRYVNQSQINPQTGVSFASGLRALLRQDPNIIMVGEIRDKETAGIAVQAALTGHILLSSLHTNDAPTAIPRLFDLDIPPFLVASTLNIAVAQRLVRRICSSCIATIDPGPEMRSAVEAQLALLHPGGKSLTGPKSFYRGKGCPVCGMSGYRGRLGVFEYVLVTDRVKEVIIDSRFTLERLVDTIRGEGFRTMFEDGLEKVELGMTTIDEVMRVIRE